MTKLKVEVVEPNGFMDGAIKREEGDVFTSENGAEYVRLGWCKNFETGETGERKPGSQKIEVQNLVTKLNP
jgi:hypothetical protein